MFELYKALQLSKTASDEDIKKAYRKLAKQYHPDVNPNNKEAEKKFNFISEAYTILGDKSKRKEYDLLQEKPQGNIRQKATKTTTGTGPIDFNSYSKSFEQFFGFDMNSGSKIEKETKKRENPLDASDIFDNFMGFKM